MAHSNTPALVAATIAQPKFSAATHSHSAPWVETGFMQLERTFVQVAPELSATAIRAYLVHLSNAQTQGERPNSSRQIRQNAADKMGRDRTTLDKGNCELKTHGMIAKNPNSRGNAAQEWHLTPPSMWKNFDCLKNASLEKKKRSTSDAKVPHKAKEANRESFKANMDAMPENSFPDEAKPETADTIEAIALELIRRDLRPDQARRWAKAKPSECRAVLEYVKGRPTLGAGFIVTAINRPEVMVTKAVQVNAGAYMEWQGHSDASAPPAPTDEQRAIRAQAEARAVELCLAKLDSRKLAYIEACQKAEGRAVVEILERDANWELSIARRAAARERAH